MSTTFYLENTDRDAALHRHLHSWRWPVNSASDSSVNYSFELFDNVNPTSSLTLGTEVTGTLVNPGDQATYTFTGTAGQTICFDGLESTTYDLRRLTEPVRQPGLQPLHGLRQPGPFTLSQAGTYTLSLSAPAPVGTYDFALDDTSKATTIALTPGSGTTESGTLATGLTTNLYQFTGTAGRAGLLPGPARLPRPRPPSATSTARPITTSPMFYLENNTQVTLPFSGHLYPGGGRAMASNSSVSYSFELFDNLAPPPRLP